MKTIEETLIEDGFASECSKPLGEVREDWPCISYSVRLIWNKKLIWNGEYRMGVGHVNWKQKLTPAQRIGIGDAIHSALNTLRARPHAQLLDKQIHADAAAQLARIQGVIPKLPDVLYSLLMDGSAFFNAQTFEDWCADYGYDADSRKAEEIYKECNKTGRDLMRWLGYEKIKELRELFADY